MSATVIDRSVLTAGLTQLGLTSNLDVLKGFESYAELLLKWNKVYNLTAIRNPEEVLTSSPSGFSNACSSSAAFCTGS